MTTTAITTVDGIQLWDFVGLVSSPGFQAVISSLASAMESTQEFHDNSRSSRDFQRATLLLACAMEPKQTLRVQTIEGEKRDFTFSVTFYGYKDYVCERSTTAGTKIKCLVEYGGAIRFGEIRFLNGFVPVRLHIDMVRVVPEWMRRLHKGTGAAP